MFLVLMSFRSENIRSVSAFQYDSIIANIGISLEIFDKL